MMDSTPTPKLPRPAMGKIPFQVMAKPGGAACNLRCQYCYYLPKGDLYPGGARRMSAPVLETYIRAYLECQPGPEVVFAWQGGEPALLGLDFYREAVRLQEKYRPRGVSILNTIQTNGLLVDAGWAQFFKQHGFLVGVSLDGPAGVHDAYRVDQGGGPTQAKVVRAIDTLREYEVDFNILACVQAANGGQPREVYRYLRDQIGAQFIQFIPVVERLPGPGGAVSERSVGAEVYGEFLCAVFDEWVQRDVGRVFVQIFDVTLAAWCGFPPGLCIFNETCGQALALEHNGDLYACDHYVEPGYRLGNITETKMGELARSPAQAEFGRHKLSTLPQQCRECPVRFACNGGCPKDRFLHTASGEAGLNYLCAGYDRFLTHTAEAMQAMAAGLGALRPAAEVLRNRKRK